MKTCLPGTVTRKLTAYSQSAFSLFLIVSFSLLGFVSMAQGTISNVTVTGGSPICAGSAVTVTFDAVNGGNAGENYTNSTVYQAYLSNATRTSFVAVGGPFSLSAAYNGALNGTTSGLNTSITIPAGTASGAGYKISIGSTNPTYDGSAGANASAAFSVTAQVTPAVTITRAPTGAVCSNESVTFTANTTSGGPSPLFQFKVNGINVGTNSTSNTYTASGFAQGDQVSVVMTANNPCQSSATATSNTLVMTVNDVIVPSVTITSNTTSICPGGTVNFSVGILINGGTNPTYQWQIDGTNVPGATGSTFSTNILTNGQVVSLQVNSNGICAFPAQVNSNGITITVNPNASISLSSAAGTDAQTKCVNTAITNITYAIGGGGTGATVSGLPAGVTGSYSGGVFTISGTPTATGTFNYTITTTGSCAQTTINGTITVNGNATVSLTSGNNTQTRCINVAIANITYTVAGTGTGASVSGLPSGVTGSYAAGVFTISGTPTATGTFNYTVTATGTCASATATGTITVNPDATIVLSSAAGTDAQTKCVNTAITNITYAIGGGGTGATVSGLPAGVTGSYAGGVFTISGTPTATGTFNYTVTTSGSCAQTTINGTITVNGNATVSLTSGNNTQTRCINVAIANITYTVAGTGTGASVSGLPSGVTGSYAGGVFTISGTPTATGTFNYTVTATGTCASATATGTITVNPDATISLSSAAGTDAQIKCVNTAITNITYAIGGGGTGATVSGLPAGVTSSYAGGVFTISGTPTATGTFNYTVTTSGSCAQTTINGTITVNGNATVSLTSGNNTQTRCINVAIANITYTVAGTGTGASVSGLPSGVIGSYAAGVFTISGTPTATGTFNYTVTATGTCASATATGTITVNPDATISLSSAAGTNSQTKCVNTAITNITYAIGGGGTGATVSGLPAGVTGSFAGGVFTISGTPTATGTFNYTVTTTGSCAQTTINGTITVNVNATVSLTSGNNTQTRCINVAIANITYTVAGTGTGASVSGLPSGVTGSYAGGVFTISGTPTATGTFNYTVTATGTCASATATGTITVNPDATISLTSAASTTTQEKCINTALTPITYLLGGSATGANVSGLPAGVTGSYNSGTKVFTISGTATASGTFNYTVTTAGLCSNPSLSGTILISPSIPAAPGTITGTTNSLCQAMSGLVYSISPVVNATSYTWTVPTGWTITSGAGTNSITVDATASAISGNISVRSVNACGTSAATTYSVAVGNFAFVDAGPDVTVCAASPSVSLSPITGGATGNNNVTWSSSNGGTFSPNASKYNAVFTPGAAAIAAGTVTLTITTDDPSGPCTSVFDQLIITIRPTPTASIAVVSPVCSGTSSTITFTGTANTTVSYQINSGAIQTISLDGSGNGSVTTSPLTANTTVNLSSVQYTTGSVTCSNALSQNLTITVNPVATVSAGANQTICAGSTATMAGAFGGAATSATWSTSGTGSFNNNTPTAIYTPSAADVSAGTVTLTYTTNDPAGPCGAVNASMILTINAAATVSAGPAQTICAGSTVTMAGVFGGAATSATWSTSGTGSFNNNTPTAIYTPSAADVSAGTVTLTYTTNDPAGPCGPVNASMILTINPAATVSAGPAQTICAGSTATMAGAFGGAATSATWSTSGTGSFNNNTPTAIYTPSAADVSAGTVTLTYTTNDPAGPCGPVNASMILTINAAATVSAGPAQTICAGSTVTMAGAFGGAATSATWSTSGTGSFNNNTPTAIYTPSAADVSAGTVTLTYTTNDPAGPCGAVNASMILTINPAATVSAGPAQTICAGSTATMAGAFGGAATSATWSTSGTGSFNNNTPTAIYTPSAADVSAGTVTLTYTTNDPAGPCGPVNASMILTINAAATVSAGPAQTICAGSTVTMAGSFGGGASFANWSTSGTGSFNNNTPTAIYTPSAADVSAGTVTLTYTTNDPAGPCGAVNASMILTINAAATVSAGPAQTICAGSTVTMAGAFGGAATSATWSTSGTGSFNNNTPTAIYTPSAADVSAGTVTLTYTTNDPAGPCGAVNASMILTINPAATVSAGPAQTICAGSTATMAGAFGGAATSATWSTSGTGSFNNNTPTAIYTPSAADVSAGTVTLTYTTNDPAGPCGAVNASMILTINAAATVSAGPAQTICSSGSAAMSGAFGGGASFGTWSTSGSGTFSNNNPNAIYSPSASDIATGVVTLTYTTNDPAGPCGPVSANMVLTIIKQVIITTQPTNVSICASFNASMNVVAVGDGLTYQWYKGMPGSGTLIPGATSSTLNFAPATLADDGTYYVVVSGSSPCAAVTSAVRTLNVDQSITITSQPTNTTVCQNSPATFSVTANAGSDPLTYQWRKGGVNIAGATGSSYTIPSVTLADAGTYDVIVYGPAGYTCSSVNSTTATLSVTPTVGTPTAITISAGTEPTCQLTNGTTTTTYATTATTNTGFNWSISNPAAGMINPTTGVMTWALGFAGSVNIIVTANGCNGPSSQVIKTVTVTPTVGMPTAIIVGAGSEPACQLTNGSTTTTYSSSATNSTGLNWSISNAAAGSMNPTTGVMTWANGFSGTVDIRVTANGCNGPSAQVIRSVTITPTVSTPTPITIGAGVEPTCQLTNGTTQTTYSTTATNSTGFNWTISNPAAGSINAATGVMTWANGFSGTVNIQVTALGCNGPSAQVTRSVTIGASVGLPTAIAISAGTQPSCQLTNGTTTTTYSTTATNATGYNWSLSNAAAGTINPTTGVMTWANGFFGSVDIQVTANGCNGPSLQVIRSVTITPTVGTPTTITAGIEPTCQLTNGTTTTAYATSATNATGYNWSLSNAAAGTINASTGLMTWASGFSGSVNIQVIAIGCNGPSAMVTRTVTITPTVGTPTTITISAGTQPSCQLTNGTTTTTYATTATNATSFTWSISNASAGSINPATGVMTWANGFSGTVNIQVTANGCNGPSAQVIRTVTVGASVATPTFTSGASSTRCQGAATTTYTASAANNTSLTYSLDATTLAFAGNSINSTTGAVTFAAGWSGTSTVTVTAAGCNGPTTASHTISTSATSNGGTLSIVGASSPTYIKTGCPGQSGTINLTGQTGNINGWQTSTDGGVTWSALIANNTNTLAFSGINVTTLYRAVVQSGPCGAATSAVAVISIITAATPVATSSPTAICLGDTATLSSTTGFNQSGGAVDGTFNTANPPGWLVDGQTSNFPASANNGTSQPWAETNPKTIGTVTWNNSPATGKFAIAFGTVVTTMETPVFSTIGMPTAALTLTHALILNASSTASIQISLDGGATYLATPLATYTGPMTIGTPNGGFASLNLSLNQYLGQNNVRIKFTFNGIGSSPFSGWGIDGVSIPGTAPTVNYAWSPTTGFVGGNGVAPVRVAPTVTTTYNLVTTINGCTGGTASVTVVVNPLPSITASSSANAVCASPSAQTTTISYSSTTNNPNRYQIIWSTTPANSFADVLNTALPAGNITITVPANTAPGTYTGTLSVLNGNGCKGAGSTFTIQVKPRPTASLTGSQDICIGSTATIPVVVTGTGAVSGTLSNGTAFSGTAPGTINVPVSPSVNTTYTVASLNGNCNALAADLTGSYTVNIVSPPTVSAQPNTTGYCLGSNAVVSTTASGLVGGYQWQVSTNGGSTWSNISDGAQYSGTTTANLTVIGSNVAQVDYLYRANIQSATPCNSIVPTTGTKLKLKNVWLGTVDTDWQNGANWSDGNVPSLACDDVHILNRTNQPTLGSGQSAIKNLIIYPSAYLTLSNATLKVSGTITNNSGTFNALAGTLELNGSSAQSIAGSIFYQRTLKNLTLNNQAGASLGGGTGTDTLYLADHLAFGNVNGSTFNTNDNLTLMSRASGTASVGDQTNDGANTMNNIVGKVTVERYIGTVRKWQFLSVPTNTAQTFRQAWQEGSNNNPFTDNKPGYGMTITSDNNATYLANGFDHYSLGGPSVKSWVAGSQVFLTIPNVFTNMATARGYYAYVRGDRSATTLNNVYTSTILRTNGSLKQGDVTVTVPAGEFSDIGNPYASAIDMRKITKTNVADIFYVWDPHLGGNYAIGAYQTYIFDGTNYTAIPGGGTVPDNFIQSGAAFFVQGTSGAGSVTIRENAKTPLNTLVNRTNGLPEFIRPNLYIVNGVNTTLADGALIDYGPNWSNAVDYDDALKLPNGSENVGSLRNGTLLSVERRHSISSSDTIFLKLANVRVQNYRWSLTVSNMDSAGRTGFLVDKYTNTRTLLNLNGENEYNFNIVNVPGSYANDRFMIVFSQEMMAPVPVTLTHISAVRNADKTNTVSWKVENQVAMREYVIESSLDGRSFAKAGSVAPQVTSTGAASYSFIDVNASKGDNFYRLRSVSLDGTLQYSTVVKVAALPVSSSISVYPNPVKDKTIHMRFEGIAAGKYIVRLVNTQGQAVYNFTTVIADNQTEQVLPLRKSVASGDYTLQLVGENGKTTTISLFIE